MKSIKQLSLTCLAVASLASLVQADFTASGRFMYRDRAITYNQGFSGPEPQKPARLALVQVINNGNGSVLASGSTDGTGNYSIFVPGSGSADIVVRCFSRSNEFGQALRVTNLSNTLYSVSSAVASGHSLNSDLDTGTVISEKIFSGSSQANPFNMLDQMVAAIEYIKFAGGGNPTSQLRVNWPGSGGSFASGTNATMSADDGYDDLVILHEIGHVVHNVYSDSDNPGGSHGFGFSDQDPRLSYGEGWASFFAGAVRQHQGIFDPGFYMDCSGNGSTGPGSIGLRTRMENSTGFSSAGEADEVAVMRVLWDVVDTASTDDGNTTDDDDLDGSITFGGLTGDEAQWQTFTGPVSTASSLTIRNHWDAFFSPFNYGNHAEMEDVFSGWSMRFFADADEPNNSTGAATAITPSADWSPVRTLYYSASNPPAPGAGDSDFYSFFVDAGQSMELRTRYPGDASDANTYVDPFLSLRRPNNSVFATNNNGASVGGDPDDRNAVINFTADQTGVWTLEVDTTHSYRRTGSYQYLIRPTGSGITDVAPAIVDSVTLGGQEVVLTGFGFDELTTLEVDGQALSQIFPNNEFAVVNDSTIVIANMPLVDNLGLVDIEITTLTGSATAQIEVVAPTSPVLELSSLFAFQPDGVEITLGSAVGDFSFVCFSPDMIPTDIPGLFTLDIGNNLTSLFSPWKPIVGLGGHATKYFGPFTGIPFGTKVYWQAFVAEFDNAYAAPFVSTNFWSLTVF